MLVFLVGWLIGRSRLGLALNVIGNDETVARHVAINTTAAKLILFAVSAAFISATGAVMAPRWTYIDPALAFNPMLSFQVVIMALLGGAGRLYGPLFGVVPLVVILETISVNFPNHFSIVLGVVFIVIVYFLPDGVVGLVDRWRSGGLRALAPTSGRRGAMSPPPAARCSRSTACARPSAASSRSTTSACPCRQGEILGLIGPNGSGKTTVLNLISGALKPDGGAIRLRGHVISGLPANQIARLGIARTFQLVRVLETMSCRDNVIAGLAFRHNPLWGAAARQRADVLLDRVGLGCPRRCPRRATDLYRPEAAGAGPGAGARSRTPAARRVAGRA